MQGKARSRTSFVIQDSSGGGGPFLFARSWLRLHIRHEILTGRYVPPSDELFPFSLFPLPSLSHPFMRTCRPVCSQPSRRHLPTRRHLPPSLHPKSQTSIRVAMRIFQLAAIFAVFAMAQAAADVGHAVSNMSRSPSARSHADQSYGMQCNWYHGLSCKEGLTCCKAYDNDKAGICYE